MDKKQFNTIYREDCLSFMGGIEGSIFDVMVTSPPYNINKGYSAYKDNKDRNEYIEWMKNIAKASYRVLKDDGSFFLNIGGKPSDPILPIEVAVQFAEVFKLQNVIHWIKHISVPKESNNNSPDAYVSYGHFKPINSDLYLNQAQEYIFHFTKRGNTKLDKLSIGVPYQDKSNIPHRRKSIKHCRTDRGNEESRTLNLHKGYPNNRVALFFIEICNHYGYKKLYRFKQCTSMTEFREQKNKKISNSLKGYWQTPEGKKRRERLAKRMKTPRKRVRKRK